MNNTLKATNPVSFYYRKDLNVTKHGEYKAAADIPFGAAVKRNEANKTFELAATSAEFEGVADKIVLDYQGSDKGRLVIGTGERGRVGVGKDYEIVSTNFVQTLAIGDEVEVTNGEFVAVTTQDAVGKVVDKFANGEICIRIY